jgi:hypothetical protein
MFDEEYAIISELEKDARDAWGRGDEEQALLKAYQVIAHWRVLAAKMQGLRNPH